MKHARLRLAPGEDTIHPLFTLMTDSDSVSFAQMIDWNVGDTEHPILLFAGEGNPNRIESELDDQAHIDEYEFVPIDSTRFYLRVSPNPTPLTRKLFEMYMSGTMVILHPVVYQEGSALVSLLGDPSTLQDAIQNFSSGLEVTVEQISNFPPRPNSAFSGLSPRQREALEVALDLGYYNYPRKATHADIGERMGCAPNTASVHLQKAESKILTAVADGDTMFNSLC